MGLLPTETKSTDFNSEHRQLGEEGEEAARKFLKDCGFILSRPDYSGHWPAPRLFYGEEIKKDEDVEFEIKTKAEIFKPPPFYGHGTDQYQIQKRIRRYEKYGIKQAFVVIQSDGKAYFQWLHKLEALPNEKTFTTRRGIKIYEINEFIEILL